MFLVYSFIGRDGGGNGVLGVVVIREVGFVDLDLFWVGGVGLVVVFDDLSNGVGGSESGEEESDGFYFDDWVVEKVGWKLKMMMVWVVIGRFEGWRMLKVWRLMSWWGKEVDIVEEGFDIYICFLGLNVFFFCDDFILFEE